MSGKIKEKSKKLATFIGSVVLIIVAVIIADVFFFKNTLSGMVRGDVKSVVSNTASKIPLVSSIAEPSERDMQEISIVGEIEPQFSKFRLESLFILDKSTPTKAGKPRSGKLFLINENTKIQVIPTKGEDDIDLMCFTTGEINWSVLYRRPAKISVLYFSPDDKERVARNVEIRLLSQTQVAPNTKDTPKEKEAPKKIAHAQQKQKRR